MASYDEDRYTATAGQTDFIISFDYNVVKPATINVLKDGVLQTLTTDYTLPAVQLVRFVVPMIGGEYVLIKRSSDFANRPGNWEDEDALTESLHNKEDDEGFRRDQELQIKQGLPRALEASAWDAQANQGDASPTWWPVQYVADPVALHHAVNLNFLQNYVSGGSTGVSGVQRKRYTGNGSQTTYNLVTAGQGQITDEDLVIVFFNGVMIPPTAFNVAANKIDITFTNPVGEGVKIEALIMLAAIASLADGELLPAKIALAENRLIQGDGDGYGTPVALSSIDLDAWGVPTDDLSMGTQKITDLVDPEDDQDAATKIYVDGKAAVTTGTAGGTAYSWSGTSPGPEIANASGKTQFVNMTIINPSTLSSNKTIYAQISNDDFGTDQVVGAWKGEASAKSDGSIFFMVPADYSWRLKERDDENVLVADFTFYYQTGTQA